MGKLQEDSKAGMLRRIEELEKQLAETTEESNKLFDQSEAYLKALNAALNELVEERWGS